MLYEKYANESAFRADFLRPLLTRLGFVSVAELHGAQEYGKDFTFSELTPFGFLRHYAAVVKHEKSISQPARGSCDTVLAQVRQAFSVTFRLPDSDAEHRVSSVFVFNSGKITENARVWLRAELDEERYGRNVHMLDGERLFQLDLASTFRQGEQLLPKLQGLQNDLNLNIVVWRSMQESLPSFAEGRGCFTAALERFVAAPFLTDRINLTEVVTLFQECRIIDRINFRYMQPIAPKGERREQETTTLQTVIQKAMSRAILLQSQVTGALNSFQLLTSMKS